MDAMETLAGSPGTLTVGGREYSVKPATAGDMLREGVEMRRIANAAGAKETFEVESQYCLPEGVRWRLWYHLNRSGHSVTREQANALVTEFNSGPICVALDEACRIPGGDEKKAEAPPSGTPG